MAYTVDYLIQKRKDKWEELHSIEYDKEFREAVGSEILTDPDLFAEVYRHPEKLVELCFIVVDKNQQTMPFFFNEVQQDFVDTLNQAIEDYEAGIITDISLLVLKGRQQGFTTVVTAIQLAYSITRRNFQGFTLADKSDNSEAIFQNKAKFPYSMLPDCLKPTEKFNNRRQLLFEKINSSWAVDTATKNVGRSKTVNFFHGSECAFWTDGIASVQGALGEAFTKNCIKIWESTANGFNDYQKMWDSGVHINCFYEWWRTNEYRIQFRNDELKQDFLHEVAVKKGWIWDRLRWLQEVKELEPEQLFWYWNKYEKYLDKDLIKQEYPCTPHEAFLLSGKNVFDTEIILERLAKLPKPLKTGYFAYDYDGLKITNIKWINDKNGYIKLYQMPNVPAFTEYCIGGDTAGEGSDYFTGHVLDARTGEQVAVLRHQFDADQYTRQMYCLGKYYKDALIGIEANFDSYPIMELQRLGYLKQYAREAQDTYTGKTEKRFGFKTTSLTRPTIISRLIEIVREHCNTICDKETLEELLTIVRNEKGRIEAPEGGHDDMMMGLAIAHHIKEQVVFTNEPIEVTPQYHFNVEKFNQVQYDYGESMVVV
jgi:hypothetical protein